MRTGKMVMLAVVLVLGFGQTVEAKYASSLEDYSTPGPGQNPNDVLGAPDVAYCQFDGNPGNPGYVEIGFDSIFFDMPGNDIVIHLFDWPPDNFLELFSVEVSLNGQDYFSVGIFDPTNYSAPPNDSFSLEMDSSVSLGRVMINVVPVPGSEATSIVPL